MPNCVQWVQIAVALTRIGAVLVPLSTLLQPPELVAQLRVASVQILITVEEFRGHRYLDDLAGVANTPELPALREVWTPDRLLSPRGGRWSTRWPQPSPRATRSPSCSPREAAGRPRASSTRTATRWARCDPASPRAASTPTPGCTCRCRSSGWAVSAAACCPRCWRAPRSSPSRSRGPRRRCACWSANGSRCFAAGPTRPKRWHANPPLSEPICPRCGRAAWRRCCRPSNAPNRVRGRSCSG